MCLWSKKGAWGPVRIGIDCVFFRQHVFTVLTMLPAVEVLTFDGKGSPFAGYEGKAVLSSQVTKSGPGKEAAALILRRADNARQVCVTSGRDRILKNDGVRQISRLSRGHFAPDLVDANYREVVRFAHFKWTDQRVGAYLTEFKVLRHKAEARMVAGG